MNPFFSVWLHPKQTARYLIEKKTVLYAIVLIVIGLMASSILGFQNSGMYPDVPYVWIVVTTILFAPLIGIIAYFISVGVSFLVGKLLRGAGGFWDIAKALSLSTIPMIFAWPIYVVWLVVSPESFFLEEYTDIMAIIGSLVMAVTSIWSFVITIGALAEAHRYSNWRAFFTLIIPSILIFSALIAIIFFIIAAFTAANM